MINPNITYNQVYYVESPRNLNPVAIRPHIIDDRIEWEDTARGTYVGISKIRFTPMPSEENPNLIPDKIEIITENGDAITFYKLNLEIYNKEVKEYVAGSPEFESDEELQNYYLETNFDMY